MRDFATGFTTNGGPQPVGPIGITFSPGNILYVGDLSNGFIYRFGPQGGVASPATQLNSTPLGGGPAGLAFGADGRLYLALVTGGRIVELDPRNGSTLRTVTSAVKSPAGLAIDPLSGDLFASGPGGFIIRVSNPTSPNPRATPYVKAQADGIAFGDDGTLYASEEGDILKVSGTDTPVVTKKTVAVLQQGDGIAVGAPDGRGIASNLFVNRTDGVINKVGLTSSQPAFKNVLTGGSRGDFLAAAQDGCLYATQSDRILKITRADGSCLDLSPSTPGAPYTGPDRRAPRATFLYPLCKNGRPGTRLLHCARRAKSWRLLRGRVFDSFPSSGVRSVEVNLVRRRGRACSVLTGRRVTRAPSCTAARGVWARASVRTRVLKRLATTGYCRSRKHRRLARCHKRQRVAWTRHVPITAGTWRLRIRATDRAGNQQTRFTGRSHITLHLH